MDIERIDKLIALTAEHDASDLFLGEEQAGRLKINGQLWIPFEDEVLTRDELVSFWQHCGADPENDLDEDAGLDGGEHGRFRVNMHRQRDKLAAVLRRIKTEVPNLETLGAPMNLLKTWLQAPSGLALVAGATGSGKSTTLAACLDWLNKHAAKHIVTIEDPIEYLFENEMCYFTQRAVGLDTNSFANGLRGSLRQAPDVILLGEIRDIETATTALQAAETGHLVLSTVHSSTVPDTLERLITLFDPSQREGAVQLLSQQLLGVLCQKLVSGAEGGRVLVPEHFHNEGATRKWIRESDLPAIADFIARGDEANNVQFMASLVRLCEEGKITTTAAEKASGNPTEFKRAFRGIS